MSKFLSVCNNCGSKRIIYVRHDMDWGGGDLTRLNDDRFYEEDDPKERDEYDIEFHVCLSCGKYEDVHGEEIDGQPQTSN